MDEAYLQAFLKQYQHLKIELKDIIEATNNFSDKKCIGVGGFGNVYEGELSHSKGKSMVAIKRLNLNPNEGQGGQGTPEFLKEITTLFRYSHVNLISLLGFCYEDPEMILVYEHASRGSLDRYLMSPHLTWVQRLKICLDAAKGLSYIHDPRETHQRIIHCDVKSSNILIDDKWNGKVSDFGLSITGAANGQNSVIVTFAAGTHGYVDPQYEMTHTMTKESDVYSFGVVLFEVLCGKFCCTYSNGRVHQNFVSTWVESCKEKKLNNIVFKNIKAMDQTALEILSDIACRCLKKSRKDRPDMAEVVRELESAFECQELVENEEFKGEWNKQRSYYEKISKTAEPPLNYKSEVELMRILSKGVLLNGGKTYFSLNTKGEHCEIISIAECLGSDFKRSFQSDKFNPRFSLGTYISYDGIFNTRVKPQFLSPGITYTVNLVFKFSNSTVVGNWSYICLRYKLEEEAESSISYFAYKKEDGWWTCELFQFTSEDRNVHLQILFTGTHLAIIEVEGIEFRPMEKVEHNNEKQPISDADSSANWDENFPTDYEDIMKWSTERVQWTTQNEAYSIIRKGFLLKKSMGNIWFSLDQNGKKCLMVSVTDLYETFERNTLPSHESRFGVTYKHEFWHIYLDKDIESQLLSAHTTYAVYLVYKLQKDQFGFEIPLEVNDKTQDHSSYIYLVSPQTPVIRPKANQSTHNPLNWPKINCLPQQRNDGWMEVQITEFKSGMTTEVIRINLTLSSFGDKKKKFTGLIIEGIEIRPM